MSDRPTLDSLVRRRRVLNGMYAGTHWRHNKSGGIYRVSSIGIRESDYEPIVHYSPVDLPDMEWDRVLNGDFLSVVDGEPRFSKVTPKVTYER